MIVEAVPGETVEQVAARAITAAASGRQTSFTFNDVEVPVLAGDTPDDCRYRLSRVREARARKARR